MKNKKVDFVHKIEPQYYIKIGIKDKKVCCIDWEEMIHWEEIESTNKMDKRVAKYLAEALSFHRF